MTTTNRLVEKLPSHLAHSAEELLSLNRVPGASISLVIDDIGYHHAYGVKSVTHNAPITANTPMNIGSCSKAFGSALIASLVDDGLVSWDDPIQKYVPEFQLYDEWITNHATLRDLSGNRLGLPRLGFCEGGFRPDIPAEYVFEHLKFTKPIAPFRDRFTYVNAGHAAVGVAASRIAGKPFVDVLRERILHPLGMHQTSGGLRAREELSGVAGWHIINDDTVTEMPPIYTDQYLPSGGMWVSGNDAIQWLRFHLNQGTVDGKEIVSSKSLAETHKAISIGQPGKDLLSIIYPGSRFAAYCLGWATADFDGHLLVQHSGSDFGVSAMTLLFPEKCLGVTVYANANHSAAIWTAYALAEAALGLPGRDWKKFFESFQPASTAHETNKKQPVLSNCDDIDLESFAGTYVHPADGPLIVEFDDARLNCRFELGHEFFSFWLEATDNGVFTMRPATDLGRALFAEGLPELRFKSNGHSGQTAIFEFGGTAQAFDRQH